MTTEEWWPLQRLVQGWWAWGEIFAHPDREVRMRLERHEGSDVEEAWEAKHAVTEILQRGGVAAMNLVQALAQSAHNDEQLTRLISGPLESLVSEHGITLAQDLAEAAARDQRFADILQHVWVADGTLDEPSRQILQRWIPGASHVAVRGPVRERPKGRRWTDSETSNP